MEIYNLDEDFFLLERLFITRVNGLKKEYNGIKIKLYFNSCTG